ncbi:uncharacterized protein LOC143034848 [Oratosquilla oratoria]|uniref:uncharacterized protein LOC143034848 n=1 Tax=Oratosquilla oratoria TaxID=337810 RepID=UPI003F7747AF
MFGWCAFVLWATAAPVMGQLKFPDSLTSPSSVPTSSADTASHPDLTTSSAPADVASHPGGGFNHGFGSHNGFVSPTFGGQHGVVPPTFGGQHGVVPPTFGSHLGGFHQGFVPPGVSPGVNPGFVPHGFGSTGLSGVKQGSCPGVGVGGFNRFGSHVDTQCVRECHSDLQCHGVLKCCQVGCSSICRNPVGVVSPVTGGGVVTVPTSKPGFCPKKDFFSGIAGFLGLRSGAGVSGDDPSGAVALSPEEQARLESRDEERERRISRRERNNRERRSAEQDRDDLRQDRRERRLNRLERVRNRVQRSAEQDRDDLRQDRRERRLNRLERVRNRVQRSAEPDRDDLRQDRRERRLNRLERVRNRVQRQAPTPTAASSPPGVPNTRFFLPCFDECQSDFHCPGNMKCCIDDKCKKCLRPQF